MSGHQQLAGGCEVAHFAGVKIGHVHVLLHFQGLQLGFGRGAPVPLCDLSLVLYTRAVGIEGLHRVAGFVTQLAVPFRGLGRGTTLKNASRNLEI